MSNKALTISIPENMASFIEAEVKKGEFSSTSDFFRILVRDYQSRTAESWLDTLIAQRRATANQPENLIPQEDFEHEILDRNPA